MVRNTNQNEDIPWNQYVTAKQPRTRNSSLASIASFASAASISSIASKVANFWKPSLHHEEQRRTSITAAPEKYMHVPTHAAADHYKTFTAPVARKPSVAVAPTSVFIPLPPTQAVRLP